MPRKGQEEDVVFRIKCKTIYRNDCWIFIGKHVGHGYGSIWYKGKNVRLNRLICHLFHNADLSDSTWTANHTRNCTNNACWNPDHLYVGTQKQNVQDQIAMNNFHYGTDNINGGKNFNKTAWMDFKNRNGK